MLHVSEPAAEDSSAFAAETIAYAREMRALYRAAEQRAVRFRLLVEMGRDLSSVRDSDVLLALALNRATTFSGYDEGCILLRADSGALAVCAATGAAAHRLAAEDAAWEQAGRALSEGRALVVGSGPPAADQDLPESRIFLPLVPSDGQPLGVLVLAGVAVARPPDTDDLDALQLLASQLAAALQSTQLHEEKQRLVAKLTERENRLAELVDQLMRAQEEERRRIAYELHDGLAQMAAGVLQQIHTLADRYRPRAPRSRQALARAAEMAQAILIEARRVIAGLRPTVLDDFGLATALRLLADGLQGDGWEVSYETNLNGDRLAPVLETALYRISQELLTNVRKHAGRARVEVRLFRAGEEVVLTVRDDGRGFDPARPPGAARDGHHIGIAGIRERVAAFGGRMLLGSAPGKGTLVEVALMLPQLEQKERGTSHG